MGALLHEGAVFDGALFDGAVLLTGGVALLCALAGGAGSGLSLPTRGAACPSPGPNKRTWPTEMRKSDPMLFHRARSRKSRSWRHAMLYRVSWGRTT